MRTDHLVPSVHGDLLTQLGRPAEARVEFERAAVLTANQAERAHLLELARSLDAPADTRDAAATSRRRAAQLSTATPRTAKLFGDVHASEEVVPVNGSTRALPAGVTIGR